MNAPLSFKIRLPKETILKEGHGVRFNSSETTDSLMATYIGRSRIDRKSIFKTQFFEGEATELADIFDGETTVDNGGTLITIKTYPGLISTLEDVVQPFSPKN